jgi:hypothetical protein
MQILASKVASSRHYLKRKALLDRADKICPHRHGRHTAARCDGTGAAWAHLLASPHPRCDQLKKGPSKDGPFFNWSG